MTTENLPSAALTSAPAVKTFALAGKATLTFRSKKTGTRFTYKVTLKDGSPAFVSVLTGSDNEGDFTYLGTIFEGADYKHGKKSRISEAAPSAKAFAWVWERVARGVLPEGIEVWHEGRCGRCGRKLTVPESVESGLGPECAGKVHRH